MKKYILTAALVAGFAMPAMAASERKRKVTGWRDSVRRTLSST